MKNRHFYTIIILIIIFTAAAITALFAAITIMSINNRSINDGSGG